MHDTTKRYIKELERQVAVLEAGNKSLGSALRYYSTLSHDLSVNCEGLKAQLLKARGITAWTEVEV
jgi:exonuclease VII small subunit